MYMYEYILQEASNGRLHSTYYKNTKLMLHVDQPFPVIDFADVSNVCLIKWQMV